MKTVINLNASSLRDSSCLLAWHRKVVEGYRAPRNSCDIVYGTAVHKFIDTMFKTSGNLAAARDAALLAFRVPKFDKPKKLHMSDERHMLSTCFNLWEDHLSKDTTFEVVRLPNGQPATECTFSFKYRETESCVVNLVGTIDTIGKIRGGCYAIRDFKTTSSWDSDNYLANYEMSSQLRFYVMALKLAAEREPDSVLGQIGKTQVGAFIDAIFIKPKSCDNVVERSEVFQFKDKDLAEFRAGIDDFVTEICEAERCKETHPIKRQGIVTGCCEKKFGRCDFWNVCKTNDPTIAALLLKRDFVQQPYDPLTH